MDHPWGLSGPDFLLYYGVALVAAFGLAVYLRRAVRRPPLAEPLPAGDANLLAFLVDGRDRVVETSLARLVEQGVVRVTRAGKVTRATATVDDPLDQAVLDALGGRTRDVRDVIKRGADAGPVNDVAKSFARQRLRVSAGEYRRARRNGLIAPYLLAAVGLARFFNGVAGGYPVGYLVVELFVTAVVIVALHAWGQREHEPYTVHGEQLVEDARGAEDTATRVALRGLRGYPDETIASALRSTRGEMRQGPWSPSRRHRAAAAGGVVGVGSCGTAAASCGSSSGSGGSSCGGGGGCGGGGT